MASSLISVLCLSVLLAITFAQDAIPNGSFEDGYLTSDGNCLDEPSGTRAGIRLCTYNDDPIFNPDWFANDGTADTTFEVYDNTFVIAKDGTNAGGLNKAGVLAAGDEFPLTVTQEISTSDPGSYTVTFFYIGSPETDTEICAVPIPAEFTFDVEAAGVTQSYAAPAANFPGGFPEDWLEGSITFEAVADDTAINFISTTAGGCGALIDDVKVQFLGTVVPTTGSTAVPPPASTASSGTTGTTGTTGSTGTTGTTGSTGTTGTTGSTASTGTTALFAALRITQVDLCVETSGIAAGVWFEFEGGDEMSWVGLYNVNSTDAREHILWQWTCDDQTIPNGCLDVVENGTGVFWIPDSIGQMGQMYDLRLYSNNYDNLRTVSDIDFSLMSDCPESSTGTTLEAFTTGTTGVEEGSTTIDPTQPFADCGTCKDSCKDFCEFEEGFERDEDSPANENNPWKLCKNDCIDLNCSEEC